MASAIRGSRVGAGPMGEAERGDSIARAYVSYFCANGHESVHHLPLKRLLLFQLNGIAQSVVTQLVAIATIRLAQKLMCRTRLTLLTLRSVAQMLKGRSF